MTLDYSTNTYSSSATTPKLMQGTGHSAAVNSTSDASALSQLITLTYNGSDWTVTGSSGGAMGHGPASALRIFRTCGRVRAAVTFTQGGSPQIGDFIDFALIAAANDANNPKKLLFGPADPSLNNGRSKLTIDPTGGFHAVGQSAAANPTLVDMLVGGGTYYYTFVDSGAFTVQYASFTNMDESGIQLNGTGPFSVNNSTFDYNGTGESSTSTLVSLNGVQQSTITVNDVTFGNSRSNTNNYNFALSGTNTGLSWTITNFAGALTGHAATYNDPSNQIIWSSSGTPTYHWTGATSQTWTVASNWDLNSTPGPLDTVVIDTNSANQPVLTTTTTIYALYIATSGVYSSTMTTAASLTVSSGVIVGAKGAITHPANSSAQVYVSSITANYMTISGTVTAAGMGYTANNGPGAGVAILTGASYGGDGGSNSGATYGSYSAPVTIGSGANGFGGGGSGGGAVILNIANTLTVNGSILADGYGIANGYDSGGSGGSIYITASVLSGTGTLSVNGAAANGGLGGAGGGGRLAVIASTSSWTGVWRAFGGSTANNGTGAAGTIFIQTPGTNGTLIVDNNNTATAANIYTRVPPANFTSTPVDLVELNHKGRLWMPYPSTFTITAGGDITGDGTGGELRLDGQLNSPASVSVSSYTLTVSSFSTMPSLTYLDIGYAGTFNLGGSTQAPVVNLSSITVENNGTLTHWANSTAETHKLNLTLNTMTVNAGGQVNVAGMGYTANNGPGAGIASFSGASYGGDGATNSGHTYGSYSAPINIGYWANNNGSGGAGGGAVILNITNTLTVNGNILADGYGVNNGYYSGGSGGSIYITASVLSGTGTLSVNGAAANGGLGGAGGGGRLAVIASTSSWTGVWRAFGGSTGSSGTGAAGTVFVKGPGANGTLIFDNNNIVSTVASYLGTSTSSGVYTFDSILSQHKSSATFVTFSTVTIAGANVFGDGDFTSTVTLNGNLYGGVLSNVTSSGLTAAWGSTPNASSQTYTVDASTSSSYAAPLISSATSSRNATLSTLSPSTTYYLRVRPGGYVITTGIPNNWAILGSTLTLAILPPGEPPHD